MDLSLSSFASQARSSTSNPSSNAGCASPMSTKSYSSSYTTYSSSSSSSRLSTSDLSSQLVAHLRSHLLGPEGAVDATNRFEVCIRASALYQAVYRKQQIKLEEQPGDGREPRVSVVWQVAGDVLVSMKAEALDRARSRLCGGSSARSGGGMVRVGSSVAEEVLLLGKGGRRRGKGKEGSWRDGWEVEGEELVH